MNKDQRPFIPKTPMDFQKLKLERLMQNPDKPVIIPEMPKEKKGFTVPEFVRNVMGSSAGAGSGEFHVYRHLRRKEYTRQKTIDEKGEKEKLDEEYRSKLESNKRMVEDKTAKKRAKRLKRKENLRKRAKTSKALSKSSSKGAPVENISSTEEDNSEDESCSNSDNSEKETKGLDAEASKGVIDSDNSLKGISEKSCVADEEDLAGTSDS